MFALYSYDKKKASIVHVTLEIFFNKEIKY